MTNCIFLTCLAAVLWVKRWTTEHQFWSLSGIHLAFQDLGRKCSILTAPIAQAIPINFQFLLSRGYVMVGCKVGDPGKALSAIYSFQTHLRPAYVLPIRSLHWGQNDHELRQRRNQCRNRLGPCAETWVAPGSRRFQYLPTYHFKLPFPQNPAVNRVNSWRIWIMFLGVSIHVLAEYIGWLKLHDGATFLDDRKWKWRTDLLGNCGQSRERRPRWSKHVDSKDAGSWYPTVHFQTAYDKWERE